MSPLRTIAACLALCAGPVGASSCAPDDEPFAPHYTDPDLFTPALDRTDDFAASETPLTGLVVPHHLVAPHLIAGGLRLVAGGDYDRIILLHPDHFRATTAAFATTPLGFETLLGPVPGDPDGAAALLATDAPIDLSCLFDKDHGVRALLPFVARLLPGVPVLPVAISIASTRDDWRALADALDPLAGPRTLILQSTDFSHYLRHHEARQRDQETMNVLATGNLNALARLRQPDHLDSLGAMHVQMDLQARRGAVPLVLANENGQEYNSLELVETTSYMVIAFGRFPPQARPLPFSGNETLLVGGDLFLGRSLARLLPDELVERRVAQAITEVTGGLPLVVNLEGVLLPQLPATLDHMVLAMPSGLTARWLTLANIRAAGLANNHALDIGLSGYAETIAALADAGVDAVGQGERLQIGRIALVALSDLGTNADQRRNLITPGLLGNLIEPDPTRPVVALVHWGREYDPAPGPREVDLASAMRAHGAAIVLGAHPHVASDGIQLVGGGETAVIHSLGNFLFDQGADRASGALAELTVFPQGTVFLRQIPMPNLFDIARGLVPEG